MTRHGAGWIVAVTALMVVALAIYVAPTASRHAYAKHGDLADYVVSACKQNGPQLTLRSTTDKDKYYQICETPDHRWGVRVVKVVNGKLDEVTAYIRERATTMRDVAEYLMRDGAATKYTGPLP